MEKKKETRDAGRSEIFQKNSFGDVFDLLFSTEATNPELTFKISSIHHHMITHHITQ